MPDQAAELRNYVVKHGRADEAFAGLPGLRQGWLSSLESNPHSKSSDRLALEFDVITLGFDMYEVMRLSDATLRRIKELAEERWK